MASGWFSNLISDGGWIGPALMAGATLYVGSQAAASNVAAANIAARATAQQNSLMAQAQAQQQQQYEQTNAMLEQQKQQAAPAVAKLQQTAASDPSALTTQQRMELDDTRRQALSALQVSGLRGSGRATVATVRKTEDATKGRLIAANQSRVDAANNALSAQYFNTTGQQVNAASANTAAGTAAAGTQAGLIGQQAGIEANANLANTSVYGRAIGDVAAVTADTLKEGRRSYYRDNKPGESAEQSLGGN